jgi:uroporphyrin-III C-methyltransferase
VTDRADRDCDGRLAVFEGGAIAPARPGEGKVWLVGAGPGDPELLTLKAARLLASADVVVHDRLVPEAILALAGPGQRLIHVGKQKSRHSVPQEGINDLLVALARQGLQVVRLKGGDPFVFGRGGEELLACRAAGVACEVAPGITAGLAASAAAGAPLTHRGLSQAVTFITGHAAPKGEESWGEPELDWATLARPNHTLVVYMGVSTAAAIAARLTAAGRAPQTPVLLVENASRADERRLSTTLAGLAEAAASLAGPAVLIIGEVAALADVQGVVAAAESHWKRA